MSTREREKAERRKEERKSVGPQASLRYLRMAPRKVRLVVDLIRGENVEKALNMLAFSNKRAAEPIGKVLRSAVANADVDGSYDLDRLYVRQAYVNEGPTWRRWRPRAMGRATRIRKRTSHVTVVLGQR